MRESTVRRLVQGLFALTLIAFAPSLWAKGSPTTYCSLKSCSYVLDLSTECATLPSNYELEVDVSCVDEGLGAQLPELVLEDGTVLESQWQQTDETSRVGGKVYERIGPDLPVGSVVRVMHRVPSSCYAARLDGLCTDGLACVSDSAKDCCALFDEAGLGFSAQAEVRGGAVLPRTAGPAGLERPLSPLSYEYTRFRVVEPDLVPPPEVQLRVGCRNYQSEDSGIYAVDLRVEADDLTDAVELELLGQHTSSGAFHEFGTWTAAHCSGQPARQFDIDPIQFPEPGPWQLFVRSRDAAGNTSDGPSSAIDFPYQCSGVAITPPNPNFASLCGETPYVVDTEASWCSGSINEESTDLGSGTLGEGGATGESDEAEVLLDLRYCSGPMPPCDTGEEAPSAPQAPEAESAPPASAVATPPSKPPPENPGVCQYSPTRKLVSSLGFSPLIVFFAARARRHLRRRRQPC